MVLSRRKGIVSNQVFQFCHLHLSVVICSEREETKAACCGVKQTAESAASDELSGLFLNSTHVRISDLTVMKQNWFRAASVLLGFSLPSAPPRSHENPAMCFRYCSSSITP